MHHPPAMPLAAERTAFFDVSPGTALVALGGLALYVASRAAADALTGGEPRRAGLRALGHCLPIAVVALLCLRPSMGRAGIEEPGIGRAPVAVALAFSTSVACLTLVLGIVTYLAPLAHLPPSRKAWPFVLPAALLALVAGFNGHLTWWHASLFALLGGAVLNLWIGADRDERHDVPFARDARSSGSDGNGGSSATGAPTPTGLRWVQFALALSLALVGGWALTRGVSRLEQTSRLLNGVLLAGTVLGPLLVLPVLGSTARLAERGHADSAVSTLVAMPLINLCAVLPLVVIVNHLVAGFAPAVRSAELDNAYATLAGHARAAPYPVAAWRVDTVVLIVLGFALIPWSLGRWAVSRLESLVLIFGYALYLALVALVSTRWR